MQNFNELGLPEALNHTLAHMKFEIPTPIQAAAIPPALEGKDVLGSAQTGTGKTAAFGIPLVTKLMTNPRGSALIMTPTRELAVQVMQAMQSLLGKRSNIKTALLIGGESMPKQLMQLRARPRVIVGTPGRINDHLTRGSLMLHDASFLVLDETDRMLDMGFSIQIEKIMKYLPKQRQTLLFSATLPHDIVKMTEKYLNNPVRVAVGAQSTPAPKIKQEELHVSEGEKYQQLLTEFDAREGSIIVFVKTKWGAEKMAKKLRDAKYSADAIHGDLRHNQRERVIAAFRNRKHRILVATDIAARGLDIPHIEHVINYDLPQCPEDYIHRIGRTARAGAEGSAICFITPADRGKWRAIERLLNPDAKQDKPHYGEGNGASRPKSGKKFGRKKPFGEGNKSNGFKKSFGARSDGENSNRSFSKPDGERSNKKPFGARSDSEGAKKPFRFKKKDGNGGGRSNNPNRSRDGQNGQKKSFGRRKVA